MQALGNASALVGGSDHQLTEAELLAWNLGKAEDHADQLAANAGGDKFKTLAGSLPHKVGLKAFHAKKREVRDSSVGFGEQLHHLVVDGIGALGVVAVKLKLVAHARTLSLPLVEPLNCLRNNCTAGTVR